MANIGFTKSLLILAVMLLGVKLLELYDSGRGFGQILLADSQAEAAAEGGGASGASEGGASGGGEGSQELNELNAVEENSLSVEQIRSLSDEEVDILRRLSDRRNRLLSWERELKVKSSVLSVTEERLDKKLEDLRTLKKKVDAALEQYQREEDKKTQSLVKIYENMKPKNAAEIISRMKIINILPIIDKMKEKSAADILAKMEPRIAKEVTSRLTEVGRMKE